MTQQITCELDLTFRCNYTTLPQRYIYIYYMCIRVFQYLYYAYRVQKCTYFILPTY